MKKYVYNVIYNVSNTTYAFANELLLDPCFHCLQKLPTWGLEPLMQKLKIAENTLCIMSFTKFPVKRIQNFHKLGGLVIQTAGM